MKGIEPLDGSFEDTVAAMTSRVMEIELALAHQHAVVELAGNPAWERILDTVRGLERYTLEVLATAELTLYQLGLKQGYLSMARLFASAVPKPAADIAKLRDDLAELKADLEQYRKIANPE